MTTTTKRRRRYKLPRTTFRVTSPPGTPAPVIGLSLDMTYMSKLLVISPHLCLISLLRLVIGLLPWASVLVTHQRTGTVIPTAAVPYPRHRPHLLCQALQFRV